MMPADLVMARYTNTRGSRVNDPDLERYLRDEYPGGMTVEALLAGTVRPNGGVRSAFVRFVKAVLRDFDRLKPAPPPIAPCGGPPPGRGAQEVPKERGGHTKGPPHRDPVPARAGRCGGGPPP